MQGPFMFASIRLGPAWMPGLYITQLISDLLAALFITLILMKLDDKMYWDRFSACFWLVLAAFALKTIPMWNWYGFGTAFTLAELFDLVGRGLIGGLVIAKFTER